MNRIILDASAGDLSAELVRRGVAANARVHALIEVRQMEGSAIPMAAVAEAGGAFEWLADEPELYTDADLIHEP